jgi:hypothetical protein
MKILDVTPITDASEFPVKKGTLQFLQDAHQETMAALIEALIGAAYNPAVVYILVGVVNSGTYPAYSITAGAAFYNGEVFLIDPATFTATGSNVAIFQIVVSQYTTDADPVTFTDTTVRNVHNIRKLQIVQGATGSGIADYSAAFVMNFFIPDQLNLTAPNTGTYLGNLLQLIGSYPNIALFVPPSANPNPILTAGSVNVGDVNVTGTGTDVAVTFGSALSTASYYVVGTVISNGTNVTFDTKVTWSIRNRLTTGFTVHFEEYVNAPQNIAFEYIIFKK